MWVKMIWKGRITLPTVQDGSMYSILKLLEGKITLPTVKDGSMYLILKLLEGKITSLLYRMDLCT